MRDGVLYLINTKREKDKYGVYQDREEKRQIFCRVSSVGLNEFFAGGKNGLKPDKRFLISVVDYNDETEVEYEGQRYGIYRTYENNLDNLELYVERKTGAVRDDG